jgi:PAS domain S-box-containing protein
MPRRLLIGAVGLVFLHVLVVVFLGPTAIGSLVANCIEIAISGIAATQGFLASERAKGLERPFWGLVGCGMMAWGIANLGWMYYEVVLRAEPPTGSVVRFLFAVQGMFFAMALLLNEEKDSPRLDLESFLDFTQLAIVFLLIYLGLYYIPSLHANQHAAMVREIWVEVGEDVALVLLALIQIARTPVRKFRRLCGGLAIYLTVYTIGAGISDYQQLTREAPTGTWFDFTWTLPLLLGAFWAATWRPAEDDASSFITRRRTIGERLITNMSVALAPLVVLLQTAQLGTGWRYLTSALLGISILCFAARLALSESHEAQSAENVRRHALAMDSAMDGMAIIDSTGTYIYANAAYARMLGWENFQFLLGKSWQEVNPRDMGGTIEEVRKALQEKGRWFGALTLKDPEGTALPVEMAITMLPQGGVVCVGRDITARRKAEMAQLEAEFKYRTFIEQVAAISYIAELGAEGQWLYVSPQVERILGYTLDEWLTNSRKWLDHIPVEDRPTVLAAEEASKRGEPFQAEYRMTRRDGRVIWVTDTAVVVRGSYSHPVMEGIIVDITERKQLELQLQRAQRMEAVGRLAGGIAHDFNNLLTIIKGYTELALNRADTPAALRGDISQIDNAAERASALVRQLLAFGRKQVLQPKTLDLNAIVQGLHKLLQRLMGEDIEMVLRCSEELGTVKADPVQIEQVIMNLVVNARDAMPGGGRLTIETGNVDLDAGYAMDHATVKAGKYVMLAVSDTGTGMDAQTQAHIFEPFYTTKAVGRGTGLGLSTAYGIVKQSGGYIWVYSEVGHGSTFKVYLPRADGRVDAGDLRTKAPAKSTKGTETILLVEDDKAVRELTQKILEEEGHTVLLAETAAEAERVCAEHVGQIHLMLTDVVMPGISGRELARRVAKVAPQTRVLFMSGYTDNVIAQGGTLEPGLAFLQKPFTPAALARKVREVLEEVGDSRQLTAESQKNRLRV